MKHLYRNYKRPFITQPDFVAREIDWPGEPFAVICYYGSLLNKKEVQEQLDVSSATIHINNKLNVNIEEFPHNRLYEDKTSRELQGFLTKKVQEDVEKLLDKLQDAPSDALGIGRKIRAFHPKVRDEKWGEKFASLTLKPKITITRTRILE